MAGTLTHAIFAEDLYSKFDKKKQKIFQNYLENMKTFAQGHDILFFYYSLNLKKGNYIRKKGSYFHKNNTKKFFINLISYIKNNNLENNIEILSFLYGYICHYSLDHTVHPYVTYKSGIFKSKKKETYKYNSKHSEIETYIDFYMIKNVKKLDNFSNFCLNYNKPSKNLIEMINYVFYESYDVKNIGKYYFKSLNIMKKLYKLLRYDYSGIKLKCYKFIDKFLPKSCKKLYPISYHINLNNDNYYLNLNHKKWNHPRYKNETYNDSFLDLYNKALDEAYNIICAVDKVLYENKSMEYLNKYFLNLSFSSGKDCNDKTKNKYFEY